MELEEEKFPLIDIPPPIMVEILRFVFADEKELRRAVVPLVSKTWYSRTMEYLATIGQQLEPSQSFLMLRHIAVFRSIKWKILSSLSPVAFEETIGEIEKDLFSTMDTGGMSQKEKMNPIFILKTKKESLDLKVLVRGSFYLFSPFEKITDKHVFRGFVKPEYRPEVAKIEFFSEKEFRADLTLEKSGLVQEYDIALHIAKTATPFFYGKSLLEPFFQNVEKISRGERTTYRFEDLLPRMLIVSVFAEAFTRVLGVRKRGEEDVKEKSSITGGGEYVYSDEKGKNVGVFVGLGSTIFKYSKEYNYQRGYARFKFPSEESAIEEISLFKFTTSVSIFGTVEEARSAIPYDRIFFSNEIPQEDLERLFMMQKKDIPGKAPGKAKMKGGEGGGGGEVYEF